MLECVPPRHEVAHGDRPWVVVKVGGTSVARVERWVAIERIVRGHVQSGRRVLLVCSALSSVTNRLEGLVHAYDSGSDVAQALEEIVKLHHELARAMQLELGLLDVDLAALAQRFAALPRPVSPRERARVLAFGELLSTQLGAAFLGLRGLETARVDARELLLSCTEQQGSAHFLSASCAGEPSAEAKARLEREGAQVVVTQGFIARDGRGDTVLLGRGGSDASAAYLAAAIGAELVEIRSDVEGLFTIDPRVNEEARLLTRLSYGEAETLALLGVKALHPRTIEPLRKQGIPLYLGMTDRPERVGTRVTGARTPRGLKAVALRRDLALVVMQRRADVPPGSFMVEVARCFERQELEMELMAHSPAELRVAVDLAAPGAHKALEGLRGELEPVCRARVIEGLAAVSLVGAGILSFGAVPPPLCAALSRLHVHLTVHSANAMHVSYLVCAGEAPKLLQAVHEALMASAATELALGAAYRELCPAKPTAQAQATTAEAAA